MLPPLAKHCHPINCIQQHDTEFIHCLCTRYHIFSPTPSTHALFPLICCLHGQVLRLSVQNNLRPHPPRDNRHRQQVLPQQSEHLIYLFIALRIRTASPMLLPTHGSAFHLQTPPARHSPHPQPSRLAVPIPPLPPHFAQPPPSSNIDLPPQYVTLTTDPHNSRNHSPAPQQLATTS
ncbi:hypothetical protein TGCOUG_306688 [Toxoplasma gondii COUG]|uniref:Uncharacterized protein n=1 Tax=Toxoplasma gondii COUG TaxID=1074873 RepID=A0A2G8XLM4_TOXGO|nr:hypothetical protein TGCOUG_306688 [Toxoplasma gondii COUG]